MANKMVVNLATGLEDPERVTIHAEGVACDGCPPLERLFVQYAEGGGELIVCPICFSARQLDEAALAENARIGGATPLLDWIADDRATVFSY